MVLILTLMYRIKTNQKSGYIETVTEVTGIKIHTLIAQRVSVYVCYN